MSLLSNNVSPMSREAGYQEINLQAIRSLEQQIEVNNAEIAETKQTCLQTKKEALKRVAFSVGLIVGGSLASVVGVYAAVVGVALTPVILIGGGAVLLKIAIIVAVSTAVLGIGTTATMIKKMVDRRNDLTTIVKNGFEREVVNPLEQRRLELLETLRAMQNNNDQHPTVIKQWQDYLRQQLDELLSDPFVAPSEEQQQRMRQLEAMIQA